ncbi:hypothetical protein CH35J_008189 [Colletotrichum higginsianum]|uniref:Uncharacterized protein n=1 Tax=Colletotrichum higginsianum TaxID=80884 RepID=A0A4T0VSQ1_9PEZI|nr:hypothetical protein CH35J_008189 [Colletotrichum higginsianum]
MDETGTPNDSSWRRAWEPLRSAALHEGYGRRATVGEGPRPKLDGVQIAARQLGLVERESEKCAAEDRDYLRESEFLRNLLALEDEHIQTLHASLREAYARRAKIQENFNARWRDPGLVQTGHRLSIIKCPVAFMGVKDAFRNLADTEARFRAEEVEDGGRGDMAGWDENKENNRPTRSRVSFAEPLGQRRRRCRGGDEKPPRAGVADGEVAADRSVESWLEQTLNASFESMPNPLEAETGDTMAFLPRNGPEEDHVRLHPRPEGSGPKTSARRHGPPSQRQQAAQGRGYRHSPYSRNPL